MEQAPGAADPGALSATTAKAALRRRLRDARRDRVPDHDAAGALAAALPLLLELAGDPSRVAAYAGRPGEPPTDRLLAALREAGRTVLLPVLQPDDDLDWAVHAGTLREGRRGLAEPAGPCLGPDAVGGCGLLVVPALAAGRDGSRLGQGGGSYDRALARVPAGVPVVAVVWPEELLHRVPVEPHDRPVSAVLTPSGLTPTRTLEG